MRSWLGLAASILVPVAAAGGQPPGARQFAAVMQDPGHRALVLRSAEATPAWTHIACAGAVFTPLPEIAVYAPVMFDRQGEPVSGEWRESVVASGCGAPLRLNVLTRVTAPARLETGFLLPGGSIAGPQLQNAAQGVAVQAAGGIPAGCRGAFIADTEFAGYQAAAGKKKAWKEVWTLDLCGPPKRVAMRFGADAAGVSIGAAPIPPGW